MDAIRALRTYAVVAVVLFGIVPVVMVTLLVIRGNTPSSVGWLLIGGIPLILCAIALLIQGLTSKDPQYAAQRLYRCMAFVAGADVLLLGGNALIRMSSS